LKLDNEQKYVGVDNDENGGMTASGRIIRDAWVFGILPEAERCEGWGLQALTGLYEKVSDAWEPYGHLPSRLPPDLFERHRRIYEEAMRIAREKGWDPEQSLDGDR
jgi:hypothetical protein